MNQREKILGASIGAVGVVFLAFFGIRTVFFKPLRSLDGQITAVRDKLQKIRKERRDYFAAEDNLKQVTQRTFSDEVDPASAKSGALLTSLLETSGLRETDFTRLPVGPRRLTGANEIGWSVQGQGDLVQVINLLYLLEKSPQVHRLDSLFLSAADVARQVKVRFRYLTLVIEPAPIVDPIILKSTVALDSPQRILYNNIAQRDILRPLIPAVAATPGRTPPSVVPPAASGPGTFQVVSLSEWKGQPEVHVRDLTLQKTTRYKAGDALAGGTVVMVDYRPLPRHGQNQLQSYSRVIIKIGTEFWAIDRGQTFADKYRLNPEQLPEQLSKL